MYGGSQSAKSPEQAGRLVRSVRKCAMEQRGKGRPVGVWLSLLAIAMALIVAVGPSVP